jgi:hypothetical protein
MFSIKKTQHLTTPSVQESGSCRVTNEHFARLDLRKTRVSYRLSNPYTLFGSRLRMSRWVSLGSTPLGRDTKTRSHTGKLSAQQTE